MKHRKILSQVLKDLSCNEQEIDVFFKVISSNGLKISEISERSGIPRVNCYKIVDDLVSKRLLYLDLDSKVNKFYAVSPYELQNILDKKKDKLLKLKDDFVSIVPDLDKIYKIDSSKVNVRYYFNTEIDKVVADIVLNKSYLAFYNPYEVSKNHLDFYKSFLDNLQKSTQNVREILVNCKSKVLLKALSEISNPNYEYKALNYSQLPFKSDIIIYDDKVLFVNYKNSSGVLIQDINLVKSLELLHNFIWESF